MTKVTNTINPDIHASQEVIKPRGSKMQQYGSTQDGTSAGNQGTPGPGGF